MARTGAQLTDMYLADAHLADPDATVAAAHPPGSTRCTGSTRCARRPRGAGRFRLAGSPGHGPPRLRYSQPEHHIPVVAPWYTQHAHRTSRKTNSRSIVHLFYRIFVRSNEDTVLFYNVGPTFSGFVEQMFEIQHRKRYRQP
jgi:hypothetical protein